MKLADYLARENLSQKDFANRAGLSTGTVSLLVRDKVWLSREYARAIRDATGGEVTANDFVPKKRRRRSEAAECA